jgi:hypothetical protein
MPTLTKHLPKSLSFTDALFNNVTRKEMTILVSFLIYLWIVRSVIRQINLLTAIGLTPGGSSTLHIYTKTIQNNTINLGRVRAVHRFCELCPGICPTTEAYAAITLKTTITTPILEPEMQF